MKTLVVCGALLCMAGLALGKLERCGQEFLKKFEETLYFNLPKGTSYSDLDEHQCVTSRDRIRKLYTCKKGTQAVVTNSNGQEVLSSDNPRRIQRYRLTLECKDLSTTPPPPVTEIVSQIIEVEEEEVPDVVLPVESEATSPPATESEKPPPPSNTCPAVTVSSQTSIQGDSCPAQCTFYTSVYGARQARTRNYFTCCSGDVPQRHPTIYNYYTCPRTGGEPEEIVPPPIESILPPRPRVTPPPPTEIERPVSQLPACNTITPFVGSKSSISSRGGRVCPAECSFSTSTYRGGVQQRTRTYYTCCSGSVPQRFGAIPNYYICR